MREEYTEGKVRDFKCNDKDAAALAKCFNAFDDADSWPGGFTHGAPFTAERVLENHEERERIRTCVAYKGERIVGYCDIAKAELDPEAAYVGLLGVHPAFQGLGFGKALLIEITETAAEKGKRRLDLHTWGGNLKAMPLYKKVGWNWVPKTRVLMENYIPGIISCEIFKPFFERYYWYDAFDRVLTQEVDNIKEDGIGIYRYRFSGKNGDQLEVIVDREAKGICGFCLTLDDETVSVEVRPDQHEGYIGFQETAFELEVKNKTESRKKVSCEIKSSGQLTTKVDGRTSGVIESGGTFNLPGRFEIQNQATHLNRDKRPDEKVETYAEFHLEVNGEEIDLYSGIIPIEGVSLSFGPEYPCLAPGESKKLDLILENHTRKQLKGFVRISSSNEEWIEKSRNEFQIESQELFRVEMKATASEDMSSSLLMGFIEIIVKTDEGYTAIRDEKTSIPVLGPSGAVAYQALDKFYVLETSSWRIHVNHSPPMEIRRIENKITAHIITGWLYLPQIGLPFPDEGSEWSQKKFSVAIENDGNTARIVLKGTSIERPGLEYQATYAALQGDLFQVSLDLQNNGTSNYENLGVRIGGWTNQQGDSLSVPLRKGLYQLDSPEWTGWSQIPKKPEYYEEEWASTSIDNGRSLIGSVWSSEGLKSVDLSRRPILPTLEYRLDDLPPGAEIEKQLVTLVISQGDWHGVRKIWKQTQTIKKDVSEIQPLRTDLEVVFRNMNDKPSGTPQPIIFLDKSKTNHVQLQIEVIHRDPIEAKGIVRLPTGVLAEEDRDIEFHTGQFNIDEPYQMDLDLSCEEDCPSFSDGGEIELHFADRIVVKPLVAIVYDSESKYIYRKNIEDETPVHLIESNGYSIGVSPDYSASLVQFGEIGNNVFYDTFPEAKPFIWFDRYYSGMTPILRERNIWEWESTVPQEDWTVERIENGAWRGYEMKALLEHCPEMEDITVTITHLLLQGVPIVHSRISLRNLGKKWRRVSFGLRGIPKLDSKTQSEIHTIIEGKKVAYKPTPMSARLLPNSSEGWAAFCNPETGQVLGIIVNEKSQRGLALVNDGKKAQRILVNHDVTLKPGERRSLSCYLIIAPSINLVQSLKSIKGIDFGE